MAQLTLIRGWPMPRPLVGTFVFSRSSAFHQYAFDVRLVLAVGLGVDYALRRRKA